MDDATNRVGRLFWQKVAAAYPDHPWLKRIDAQQAIMRWKEPRRVDVWWWMDIEFMDDGILTRGGRVSWNQDGTGFYGVSMDYAREGVGLSCWPSFRALADAQEFVERLMVMPLGEAQALHGTQWPGVVL